MTRGKKGSGPGPCRAEGCEREGRHVGWCNTHYWRVRKYGVPVLPKRQKKRHHPNYMTWHERKVRGSLCDEWAGDFWKFVDDIGVRPSKDHYLYRPDQSIPYSNGTCYWELFLKRGDGEPSKEWHSRKWQARQERFPELERSRTYLKRFGITTEEYEAKFVAQNGVCAICGNPERFIDKQTKVIRRLAVDHCHATGKIRDLLCFSCNSGIGHFRESIAALSNAISYIRKHSECERPAFIQPFSTDPT